MSGSMSVSGELPDDPASASTSGSTSGDVETVGPPSRGEGRRRGGVVALVAVLVATILGGGAYAAYALLDGGGPQPEDVLPASTVGLVSVDLDPSAGQKIAAIRSIRKFPALKESLGLQADDDLRELAFDKVLDQGNCQNLDFETDILPWLGKRAAVGAVDLGSDKPVPVLALQINDPAKAKAGFGALLECTRPDDVAFVVGEDYVIASDTADHARTIQVSGGQDPLADDATYRTWTSEVGEAGILSFYISPKAADYVQALVEEMGSGFGQGIGDAEFSAGASAASLGRGADEGPLADFRGLAGTLRFSDGGVELAVAAGGSAKLTSGPQVGSAMAGLPDDTAVALGFGVPVDAAKTFSDQLGSVLGGSSEDLLGQGESGSGLDAEDLQTLLGRSLTLSLGGDAPSSLDSVDGPEDVPAGVVIRGDAAKIKAVIATIEDHVGKTLADVPLVMEDSGDAVVIATTQEYAEDLLGDGDLGRSKGYRSAVPESDRSSGALFVDFDSDWLDLLTDLATRHDGADAGRTFAENTDPLRALGISSWTDGNVIHTLVKLTTD